MKRSFTSKQERKQAEETIIRDMRLIKERLKDYKKETNEPVNKGHVMSVLKQFVQLKKLDKQPFH